jgi:3-oxoacyl-[acyl-carrier-protein] synthase II
MSELVFTGWAALVPDGRRPVAVGTDGAQALPYPNAYLVTGVDLVAMLGRKTTRFNNRSAQLAIAACGLALRDAGIMDDDGIDGVADLTDEVRDSIGLTLGTTCGSVSGIVEFGWDTFGERPYAVNPATFPNTVINTAAGAAAIKYGLRGANSTVAGGPLAGLGALRHAAVTLRAFHADTIVVGAAEEFTTQNTWLTRALRPGTTPGEGAAMFVLERADVAAQAGRTPLARLAAIRTSAADVTDPASFRDAVAAVLAEAGCRPSQVRHLAARVTGVAIVDEAQRAGLAAAVPVAPMYSEERIGDCYSAHTAIQVVDALTALRANTWDRDGVGVIVGADPDGALAVAVLAASGVSDSKGNDR